MMEPGTQQIKILSALTKKVWYKFYQPVDSKKRTTAGLENSLARSRAVRPLMFLASWSAPFPTRNWTIASSPLVAELGEVQGFSKETSQKLPLESLEFVGRWQPTPLSSIYFIKFSACCRWPNAEPCSLFPTCRRCWHVPAARAPQRRRTRWRQQSAKRSNLSWPCRWRPCFARCSTWLHPGGRTLTGFFK